MTFFGFLREAYRIVFNVPLKPELTPDEITQTKDLLKRIREGDDE